MKKLVLFMLLVIVIISAVGCSQPDADKKAMVIVSFGTSYADTRELTITATEDVFKEEFGSYDVYRAFTSQTIIDILEERDNIEVNNVKEVMELLTKEKYGEVVVQPLHVMNGAEYDEMSSIIDEYKGNFNDVKIGKALLSSVTDYEKTVEALAVQFPETKDGEAIVFMGHGTHHDANAVYGTLEYAFHAAGYDNVFVGTVEGYPTFDNVLDRLDDNNINKVTLMPLMIVAGDHANNDMAGDEEDAWKVMLKEQGYEVEIYLHGIGENEEIRKIYIAHANEAIEGAHE
ncbi:sirohydrochlorin cobaltochelatase [Clostridiaceae bacterium HSG29]|nr:sirohydrochlorin cobaltochelatase [Clostridiaceae bacterium HSG29]